jgi:repressor LexA
VEKLVVRELDRRSMDVLRLLARREARGEEPPSVREVARVAGYKSSRGGQQRLEILETAGFVERREALSRKKRPTRLTERGWEAVGEMPLLGRIAAGSGIEAVTREDVRSLVAELIATRGGRRRFLLEAEGESMLGAHIGHGDTLVVEEDESPPDGTVVVALMRDGEVTVKRLRREGELVRLQAENDGYEDIVVRAEDVRIQGRVWRVLHPPRW